MQGISGDGIVTWIPHHYKLIIQVFEKNTAQQSIVAEKVLSGIFRVLSQMKFDEECSARSVYPRYCLTTVETMPTYVRVQSHIGYFFLSIAVASNSLCNTSLPSTDLLAHCLMVNNLSIFSSCTVEHENKDFARARAHTHTHTHTHTCSPPRRARTIL